MAYQSNEYFEDNGKRLNGFDKFCCILAALLGIAFLILGILGLFMSVNANFTLPPVLGVIPAFVGWGVLKAM